MCRLALAVLSLAVLAACQPAAAPLSDEDVAAIRSLATSYAAANLAMDADAVAAVYADDAIEMPPNEPAVAGKSAVADKYASFFEQGVGADAFTVTSVEIDGMEDVAFDRGTWSWTGTPPA